MTQRDGSASYEHSASFVVEKGLLAIYLPRAVVEAADSLILDGFAPGLPVESVIGLDLNVPRWMKVRAAVEWAVDHREPWLRVKLPGVDNEVAVRTERIVGYVAGS
jgi:hypothetical protein